MSLWLRPSVSKSLKSCQPRHVFHFTAFPNSSPAPPQCLRPAAHVQQNDPSKIQQKRNAVPLSLVLLVSNELMVRQSVHCAVRRPQVGDIAAALGLRWEGYSRTPGEAELVKFHFYLFFSIFFSDIRRRSKNSHCFVSLLISAKISPFGSLFKDSKSNDSSSFGYSK